MQRVSRDQTGPPLRASHTAPQKIREFSHALDRFCTKEKIGDTLKSPVHQKPVTRIFTFD